MNHYLDLSQLKAFYHVVRTGSYTKAARTLGRTQSAVSHAVKKLEQGLSMQLVARSGRRFRLTEEGSILFRSLETVFYTLDEAMERLAQTQGAKLGRIRLGATVEFGCSILVRQMAPFLRGHPEIDVDFHFDHNLITPLLDDELDIIIDCVDHQEAGLERIPLFRELYAVVCSPEYKKNHHITEVQDLSNCTIISMDAEGSWWHNFLYSFKGLERPSLKQHRFLTIDLIRGMITAAQEGMGIALVPKYSVISSLEQGTLVQLFPHVRLIEDQFTIYQKRPRSRLLRHQIVVDYLREIRPHELSLSRETELSGDW